MVVYRTFERRHRNADLGVQLLNVTRHFNPRDIFTSPRVALRRLHQQRRHDRSRLHADHARQKTGARAGLCTFYERARRFSLTYKVPTVTFSISSR
jgi:hypothetical protein